jgi:hypothetical protein
MKLKVLLPIFLVLTVLTRDNEAFLTGLIAALPSIFNVASNIFGGIKESYSNEIMQKKAKSNPEVSQEMISIMESLNEKQMQKNDENYVNTMLKLNGIDGKFDVLTSQVTDIQGNFVNITEMLDGIDGKLNSISDLVFNIDGKMDKFSNQVQSKDYKLIINLLFTHFKARRPQHSNIRPNFEVES